MSARPLALVVEDDLDQMALLRRHLDREGFDVYSANDAESAISAFPHIHPSLAVLDLLLPGISGRECATRVREAFPDCFLVISSVLDRVDYPASDAALPKPVRGAELRALVKDVAR